jgi:N-acetylglucosamine kinase-like BadF-type ATPase
MIAIVYSGSLYANWKLADKEGIVSEFKTLGINPFFNDEKFIQNLLNKNTDLINNAEQIKQIYFFGVGTTSRKQKEIVSAPFEQFFRNGKIFVDTDLHAAALASCTDHPGIIGILGSGSNAAYFNGKKIKPNNFGLGYILGDEGSANYLGKNLLRIYLNGNLPADLEHKFKKKYDLDRKQILDKIYKQRQPSAFLSSFIDFLLENREDNPFVKDLVCSGFEKYLTTYICPLKKQFPQTSIHIVGAVASNFETWLLEAADQQNLSISSVIKEPIYNVLNYYSNKLKYEDWN